MKKRRYSYCIALILLTCSLGANIAQSGSTDAESWSRITLECDYTSSDDRGKPMHYHWNICNRISPMAQFNPVGKNELINVVRPLGGKSRHGEKVIEEDTYRWDGEKYYYNWAPLKKIIDNIHPEKMFQLVTDNPPWAFQRGMELEGDSAVEVFGNPWPPNDPKAWSDYIQAMMQELIRSYGKEQVGQWRYCIGREIGTPGHWRAGQQAFFEHYENTLDAIRALLPNAIVGTHFLWESSKHPYGSDFVKWCSQNKVHYDFIGVSYYPFYDKIDRVDLDSVYKMDFGPIKDIPEWNPDASLEIHEFALIKSMNKKGNGFENAPKAHMESFTVMLAKMMYEHNMIDIYRWGRGDNKVAEKAFLAMKGNYYYKSSKTGTPDSPGNMLDAVFAKDPSGNQYNIMVYNYNADPDSRNSEAVRIETTLPFPPGTKIKFRRAGYENESLHWSEWKTKQTTSGGTATASVASFQTKIPVFSFAKYEIIAED